MHTGKGQVLELILEDGSRYVRLACPSQLTPAPGQYLLAGDSSDSLLPVPLFYTDSAPYGFIAADPGGTFWNPGTELSLRGPLGHGFSLPASARRVCLVAFAESPAHLKGLIGPALSLEAAVVVVCSSSSDALPDEVEVQPFAALHEALEWADYVALAVRRENLNELREQLGKGHPLAAACEGQVLIHTPVPCGGVADCGICAVTLRSGWKLACKEGPVFDWKELAEQG
jgi:dihydroorotate dehydrogenase electron transfer subunit